MIVLPTRAAVSRATGLPMHVKPKSMHHKDYSKMASSQVKAVVPRKYTKLAAEVNKKEHDAEVKTIIVGPSIVNISTRLYKAIIALAKTKERSRRTDQVAKTIKALARKFRG